MNETGLKSQIRASERHSENLFNDKRTKIEMHSEKLFDDVR